MITIQKATLKDVKNISILIQENTESNPNNYTKEQQIAWQQYNTPTRIKQQFKERTIYCAFKEDKLVGTIGLQVNKIVGFYIHHAQRGKGIGKLLFNFIEKTAIQNGFYQLSLTSTPSAVKFYKKNGFNLLKKITVTIDSVSYEEFTMYKTIKTTV